MNRMSFRLARCSDRHAALVLLLPALAGCVVDSERADSESPAPSAVSAEKTLVDLTFVYSYERSPALAERAAHASLSLLRPAQVLDARELAARTARALGVKEELEPVSIAAASSSDQALVAASDSTLLVDQGLSSRDPDLGSVRFRAGNHRLRVEPRSGHVRYVNPELQRAAGLQTHSDDGAIDLAQDVIDRLHAQGLLDRAEILWEDPAITHQIEGGDPGVFPGDPIPPSGPERTVDTRVKYYRAVNGIPVSGSLVSMVFRGTSLASMRLAWRPLRADDPESAKPSMFNREEARAQFERQPEIMALPKASRVEVVVEELVYQDRSKHDAVSFVEPGYLFLYVVKSPIAGSSDFMVSKKLQSFLPALAHSEVNMPSMRQEEAPPVSLRR